MKKIAIIVLLALTLTSCNEKNKTNTTNSGSNTENIQKITKSWSIIEQKNIINDTKVITEEKLESYKWPVKNTDTISISYTGSLEDWTIFDSSSKHPWEILSFKVGDLLLISWLEEWVIGMKLGETKTLKIDAIDAYGETNEIILNESDFDVIKQGWLEKEDLVVWLNDIIDKDGKVLWSIEILRIEDWKYIAKHPNKLAWKNLIFEITVDSITEFVQKEIVSVWDNISVTYTGSLEDGTIFDASSKHWWEPLDFTAWAGQMIPGFDAWVIGMKLGETKVIKILAKDAYGEKWTHELAWKDLTFEVKIEKIK